MELQNSTNLYIYMICIVAFIRICKCNFVLLVIKCRESLKFVFFCLTMSFIKRLTFHLRLFLLLFYQPLVSDDCLIIATVSEIDGASESTG